MQIDAYLAGPYSHEDELIRAGRNDALTVVAAELSSFGWAIFSPITHSVPLENTGLMGGAWEHWAAIDEKFVRSSKALWVLCLDGWHQSTGVNAEIEIAKASRIPVSLLPYHTEPDCRKAIYKVLGLDKGPKESYRPVVNAAAR